MYETIPVFLSSLKKEFNVFKFSISSNKNNNILTKAIARANIIAPNLNSYRAKNTYSKRDSKNVLVDTIAGEIACLCWLEVLEQISKDRGSKDIFNIDYYSNESQIDIYNELTDKTIEVRSSFTRSKQDIDNILQTYNSIGWYYNTIKENEEHKDFHLQVIYPFPRALFLQYLEMDENITLYLTGGGDKELFQKSPYAMNKKWGNGSTYRIIPIINSFDAIKCTKLIIK